MDEIEKKKSKKRWLIPVIVIAAVAALAALFWYVLRPALFRKDPVHSDTVVYTIHVTHDEASMEYRNHDFVYRNDAERKKWMEYTETVEVKEAPYAWTGCYGDLNIPLADFANEPDYAEITLSCYPGVKIVFDFPDSLRVIEAWESVYVQQNVWHFCFQDLNGDDFPELFVEDMTSTRDFYAYDFIARKEYVLKEDDVRFLLSFDSVLAERYVYTTDENGEDTVNRLIGRFVLRDGQLLSEGFTEATTLPEAEVLQSDPGEPVCWFDIDNGDAMKRRFIRLPEYEDVVLEVNKREMRQHFPDGSSEPELFYAITQAYFADLDGDGKREVYFTETTNHLDRRLIRFVYDEKAHKFDSEMLYGDGMFSGLIPEEDLRYRSGARFCIVDGSLKVKMFDPCLSYESEITAEIVDLGQLSAKLRLETDFFSEDTWYVYGNQGEDSSVSLPLVRLMIPVPQGKAVMADRQSGYVLPGVDNCIFPSYGSAITKEGDILHYPADGDYSDGNYRAIFADLDGDGRHELCVNNRMVLDPATLQEITELDPGYMFVFYKDDIYVAANSSFNKDSEKGLSERILGRPVLKNGKIEIVKGK